MINTVLKGDCLIESEKIASGSVDLVLTDPPYGTMNGFNGIFWDFVIEPFDLFTIANRILRKNGKLVLFSQEPYTSQLITQALPNLPFSYRMIWEKDNFANALLANKAPVSYFEDILVFSKNYDLEELHPLRDYFKQVIEYIGLNIKQINAKLGHRKAEHSFYIGTTQFDLCTEQTYKQLIEFFNIDKMQGFRAFEDLVKVNREFNSEFNSVFNLWEGKSYKSNVLKYKKDYNGYHPTQKPLLLMEDLIKTYSNAGDLVVDLTAGSGSTAVAAITTGRNFIAIEQSEEYYKIIKERINAPQTRLELW